MNPLPRGKNTVKRNSETRIPRKSSENRRLFTRANLVVRLVLPSKPGQVQGNWLFHFSSFLTFRFCCSFGSISLSDMSLKEAWVNFFLVMATGPWRTPQSYAESKKTDVSSHNFVMQVMAGSGMSDLFAQDLDLSIGKLTRAYFLQQILDIDVSCWMRQVNISILKLCLCRQHHSRWLSWNPLQMIWFPFVLFIHNMTRFVVRVNGFCFFHVYFECASELIDGCCFYYSIRLGNGLVDLLELIDVVVTTSQNKV